MTIYTARVTLNKAMQQVQSGQLGTPVQPW